MKEYNMGEPLGIVCSYSLLAWAWKNGMEEQAGYVVASEQLIGQ